MQNDNRRWRVRVESSLCQGHNRCCSLAPELFETDELGNAQARADGAVAPDFLAKARLAVANCPERAVRLTQD